MSKQLLQKNTRFLLLWLPLVLICCSLLFYLFLRMQTHHMQEKQLQLKQRNIWENFTGSRANMSLSIAGEYDIVPSADSLAVALDEPRDTILYYAASKKNLPFEILTSRLHWNGKSYCITTYVSSTEISHLMIKVFITEVIILLILLLAIILLNRRNSRLLWAPFFETLKTMDAYDITHKQSIELTAQTGITEFNALNTVIEKLVNNAGSAYNNQKQFVENASHEMQTPLAIIRSKLELLINDPDLQPQTATMLQDITEANDRLSQMNRTLLLLAKIENNQFPDIEEVHVGPLIRQMVDNLQLYYEQFPSLELNAADDVAVLANRSLIEILLSNLVNNAVVHNVEPGKIKILLQQSRLVISNTGHSLQSPPENLFERFHKDSHASKTTGLGLSLVKQICLLYHYQLAYAYADGWHTVTVTFA